MAKINFGNIPANMGEPLWFGMGSFFAGGDLIVVSQSSRKFVLEDPVSGSTITYSGSFDFSSEFALLESRITGIETRTSSGALLMNWRDFSVTFRQIVSTPDPAQYNAFVMSGADLVVGGNGGDRLRGFSGNDEIYGRGGNDDLLGQAGKDRLIGGLGADVMDGGAGSDTLSGGPGADSLHGGGGHDTFVVDSRGDVVTEHAEPGTDVVKSAVTFTLARNVENLVLTGQNAINGIGNDAANRITGNAAANVLKGMGGNDTYVVASGDRVVEQAGGGIDLVIASVDYTLGAHQEHLTLTGAAAAGTGNASANALTGTSGENTLIGHAGNDTLNGRGSADQLIGGPGDDVYYAAADDIVVEAPDEGIDEVRSSVSYILGASLEHLVLLGNANINGTGNEGDNSISGNDGNNILNGGTGKDTLTGGQGDDTYVVDSEDDVVSIDMGGTDIVLSAVSLDLGSVPGIENLTLTGAGHINGTGDAFSNVITGNAGDNILSSGSPAFGHDTLIGGAGNDTYIVYSDVIVEAADEGIDLVQSSGPYNTLGANIENLTLAGNVLSGHGNELDNMIVGNDAVNFLFGEAGNDSLDGAAGNDELFGGAGADRFHFTSALDEATNSDRIADLAEDDSIVLDPAVFVGVGEVLDAAEFRVGASAAAAGDRIIYDSGTGELFFDADGAGGASQIRFARLDAGLTLTSADFLMA